MCIKWHRERMNKENKNYLWMDDVALLYAGSGRNLLRLTSAACGHAGAAGQAGDVAGDVAGVHAGAAGQAGDVAGLHADGRTRGGMLLRSA